MTTARISLTPHRSSSRPTAQAQLKGIVESSADTDTFTFVPPKTGTMWISLDAYRKLYSNTSTLANPSYLHLTAFDTELHPINMAHDDYSRYTFYRGAHSFLNVTGGQPYYLQLSSDRFGLGNYILTLSTAQPITLAGRRNRASY